MKKVMIFLKFLFLVIFFGFFDFFIFFGVFSKENPVGCLDLTQYIRGT